MLIRICDHFNNNPKRIDKLIAVKGLPREWFFRDSEEGPELKKPWEPDIDKNIPHDIRHMCEPMYVVMRYAPTQAGARGVIEKRQILGVRIDYNTEPGREMWDQVERYIEETVPRNERIPVPVLCSRDERSAFETYEPKRNSRGSLELTPKDIPLVDLTIYDKAKQVSLPTVTQSTDTMLGIPAIEPTLFKCDECEYTHRSKQGVRMHAVKRHPKQEKVEA